MIQKKRGEWFARDWVIALLFFSAMFALLVVVSTDTLVGYDRYELLDPEFSARYNKFTETTGDISQMLNATGGKGGLQPKDYGELVIESGFTVIALVFSSIITFNSQIAYMATDLGIPSVIASIIFPLIIGIIIVSIVFIVITSTSRNKI